MRRIDTKKRNGKENPSIIIKDLLKWSKEWGAFNSQALSASKEWIILIIAPEVELVS